MKSKAQAPGLLKMDKKAIDHNLKFFKSLCSDSKILLVVKAQAYGSQEVLLAKYLEDKVDYFGVAYIQEGINLRSAGIHKPILILHPQINNIALCDAYDLEPTLYSTDLIQAYLDAGNSSRFHLNINSGLNRIGLRWDDLENHLELLKQLPKTQLASVYSHFGGSEDDSLSDFSKKQIERYQQALQMLNGLFGSEFLKHMCNTSGIINFPQAHFDMVRLGIGIHGFANEKEWTDKLIPSWKLTSRISQIQKVNRGESIGYNQGSIVEKDTRIGIIPLGHADGIPRALGKGNGWVLVNDQRAPILGNVCMDMIMVDLSDIEAKTGDPVELFETQNTVNQFAKMANTINYELLTNLGNRIERQLD